MSSRETCDRCGVTFADSEDFDSHDCIITALPIGGECGEEVVRRGLLEPCELPAVAVRINPDDPMMVYPVCNRHARGHTVPLMTVLDDMRREVREQVAREIEAAMPPMTTRQSGKTARLFLRHAASIARGTDA